MKSLIRIVFSSFLGVAMSILAIEFGGVENFRHTDAVIISLLSTILVYSITVKE